MKKLNALYQQMIEYYSGTPANIQHLAKVHSYAKLIGEMENIDKQTLYTLELAALVHDIGIKPALEKYGSDEGKYQEVLGPEVAAKMMEMLEFEPEVIERVCYLVGHHHTYSDIDGIDYQILVEADFLVNFYEGNTSLDGIRNTIDKVFKTNYGTWFAKEMFLPKKHELSETWAQDALQELEDWIEEQGIYIRQ